VNHKNLGVSIARGMPARQGLYDPRHEHDACGVGFIANIKGRKSHSIIEDGLRILANLTHRGAVGADPKAGDGAGILIQIPDAFYREACADLGIVLPAPGEYAVGMVFLPEDAAERAQCEAALEKYIVDEGQTVLGWRDVPVDGSDLGKTVKETQPCIRQVFIGRGANCKDVDAFERKLFVIRKAAALDILARPEDYADYYVPSMSARTVVYKGMLLANQVGVFYRDLMDERVVTALALLHQRF